METVWQKDNATYFMKPDGLHRINKRKLYIYVLIHVTNISSSSSSLHGLGKTPVLACNIITSPSTFFLVFLFPIYQQDIICWLVVECESLPLFADIFSICLYILLLSHIKEEYSTHFVHILISYLTYHRATFDIS
jgi:hypothetical protein